MLVVALATLLPLLHGCSAARKKAEPPAAPPVAVAPPRTPPAQQPPPAVTADQLVIWADAEPDTGPAPLQVRFVIDPLSFDDDAHAASARYVWDFGDDSDLSREESPTHTYGTPGLYTARVKVVGAGGNVGSDEILVDVEEAGD